MAEKLVDIDSGKKQKQPAGLASANEKFQVVSEELKSLSYSISHDLRATLRAIDGFSRVLQTKAVNQLDATNLQYLNRITENVHKMTCQMDAILQLSRTISAEQHHSWIDITKMIRSICHELVGTRKTIIVEVSELPPIFADEKMIARAFKNLIHNAIKFSASGDHPRIGIGCMHGDKEIVISIKDNGVGFDPDYGHKLFSMFQRLHNEDEFEGIGAGLAIAKKIVTLHNGRVWAESVPGEGAIFYVSLPKHHTHEKGR